jgi:hypothetical protein
MDATTKAVLIVLALLWLAALTVVLVLLNR